MVGGVTKNQYIYIYRENLPEKGELGQFADLRGRGGGGVLLKKRGWCF